MNRGKRVCVDITPAVISESEKVVIELQKKLVFLIGTCNLREKLPVEVADKFSLELILILRCLVNFSEEFRNFHGKTLISEKTYLELLKGINALRELRLQWKCISLPAPVIDNIAAEELLKFVVGEKSVIKLPTVEKELLLDKSRKQQINQECKHETGKKEKCVKSIKEVKEVKNEFKLWIVCRDQFTCSTLKVPCKQPCQKK